MNISFHVPETIILTTEPIDTFMSFSEFYAYCTLYFWAKCAIPWATQLCHYYQGLSYKWRRLQMVFLWAVNTLKATVRLMKNVMFYISICGGPHSFLNCLPNKTCDTLLERAWQGFHFALPRIWHIKSHSGSGSRFVSIFSFFVTLSILRVEICMILLWKTVNMGFISLFTPKNFKQFMGLSWLQD